MLGKKLTKFAAFTATCEGVFALIFGVIGIASLVMACMGAWWCLVTSIIAFAFCAILGIETVSLLKES